MRFFIQQIILATLTLYITALIFPGLSISGETTGYLFAGFLLVMGFVFLRPVINLITLPISVITLGLFSFVTTAIVIFIVTIIDKGFNIHPFLFSGIKLFSFQIPSFEANLLLSYVLISVTIQVVYKIFLYIFDL